MRPASYAPGELIPCALVWHDPGITPCCKTILGPGAKNTFSKSLSARSYLFFPGIEAECGTEPVEARGFERSGRSSTR